MKIVATSDIHGKLPEFISLPDYKQLTGDVLIIAGDLTANYKNDFIGQAAFINGRFERWTGEMKNYFNHIIVIAGNHDAVWERAPELIYDSNNYIYLKDSSVTLDGVKFWGTPWTKPFFDWGFNAQDDKRQLIFDQIPEDVDVIISHGPPRFGTLDLVNNVYNNFKDEFTGDELLNELIERVKPKLFFCGHIHEGYGKTQLAMTTIYNCSYVDENYDERPPGTGYFTINI